MTETRAASAPQPVRWAYALAAAFLAIAGINVLSQVVGIAGALRDPVVEVSFDPPVHLSSDAADDPVGAVVLPDRDRMKALALEVPDLVVAVLLLAVASLAFGFFARTRAGRPFAHENARDLRILAVLLAVAVPVTRLVDHLAYRFVAADTILPASIDSFGFEDVVTGALVVALAAWALSTTFAYGSDLADDAAVTI
jgi:hypothetical protein